MRSVNQFPFTTSILHLPQSFNCSISVDLDVIYITKVIHRFHTHVYYIFSPLSFKTLREKHTLNSKTTLGAGKTEELIRFVLKSFSCFNGYG